MNASRGSLFLGVLAFALAACGGGSSAPSARPAATASSAPEATSGVRLTLRIPQKKPSHASKRARKPAYVGVSANGLALTIASGSANTTLDYDLDNQNDVFCQLDLASDDNVCTFTVPTLGLSETFSGILYDQEPANPDPTTGLGTGFASNANVLAIGSAPVTVLPGQLTNAVLPLAPVSGVLLDSGAGDYPVANNAIASDTETSPNRIVVTSGAASSTQILPAIEDIDGNPIAPLSVNADGSIAGQPFVSPSGSPVPITITSNTAHLTVYPVPGNNGSFQSPGPSPAPVYTMSASVASSSFLNPQIVSPVPPYNFNPIALAVSYDGGTLPANGTLTLANGLSGPYAATLTYALAAVSATPSTLTFTAMGTQTVNGSDAGSSSGLESADVPANAFAPVVADGNCMSGGMAIASIAAGTYTVGSPQTFTVTPLAAGTCTFVLADLDTNVISNPVTVTVNASAL